MQVIDSMCHELTDGEMQSADKYVVHKGLS